MIFFCSLLLNLYDFYFTACIVKFALCDNIKYRTSFNLWIAIGEKFAWDTQSRSNVATYVTGVRVYIYYVTLLHECVSRFRWKKQIYTLQKYFQLLSNLWIREIIAKEDTWKNQTPFDLNSSSSINYFLDVERERERERIEKRIIEKKETRQIKSKKKKLK